MNDKPKILPEEERGKNFVAPKFVVRVVQLIFQIISICLMPVFWARLRIVGAENFREIQKNFPGSPLLVVANHKSYFDPLIVAGVLPLFYKYRPVYFFSKDELFLGKLSRYFFIIAGAFPSFYGSGLDNSLRIPKKLLNNKSTVIMFPEGRCIRSEELGSAKVGVGALASQVKDLVVLPLAIHGAYKIGWGLPWRLPIVSIEVGAAFLANNISYNSEQELADQIMLKISDLYNKFN